MSTELRVCCYIVGFLLLLIPGIYLALLSGGIWNAQQPRNVSRTENVRISNPFGGSDQYQVERTYQGVRREDQQSILAFERAWPYCLPLCGLGLVLLIASRMTTPAKRLPPVLRAPPVDPLAD